jgi:hypothetical protein
MASFIHANRSDLFFLAKALGLNPDQALAKKELVPLLQEEMSQRLTPTPPEDAPILPVIEGSGDAPPNDNSDEQDGEGSDDDHDELDEDPENEPMEPDDDEEFLIHIFMENRPHVSLHVRSTDTISIVKTHLQHLVGVHRRDQRLHFLGGLRDLEDLRPLSFYHIMEGDALEMTIRARGGGKRGRNDTPSKHLIMAQLHGGIELFFATATEPVRAERRRMDDEYRTWDFLDGLPAETLQPLVQKIMALNLTSRSAESLRSFSLR